MDPVFLTLENVLEIHRDQIEKYGGSHGIRDAGLIESAIGMPSAMFGGEFLHPELHDMAAAYLFHLVMNHAFIDGNKRVGAMAAFVFLDQHGWELNAPEIEYADLVLAVTRGELNKADVAAYLRQWTTPAEPEVE